tara:strand:+ start:1455 stop:2138 length:684 start_codon:yes stop_codon:yes gene_type:complete
MPSIDEKIDMLLVDLEKSEHKFPHIHGDCNSTHFGHCFKHVSLNGLWIEFGVFSGKTISTIASCNPTQTIYGFDSFDGLPEFWDNANPKGAYTLNGAIPLKIDRGPHCLHGSRYQDWNSNITLIKGLFEDTLPSFVADHPENIAFMHVDSDLYSSAKTIFRVFEKRIVPGTVICFDDWCGYPTNIDRNHEIKVFAEFLIETGFGYKPLSYQTDPNYSQVGFLITGNQ